MRYFIDRHGATLQAPSKIGRSFELLLRCGSLGEFSRKEYDKQVLANNSKRYGSVYLIPSEYLDFRQKEILPEESGNCINCGDKIYGKRRKKYCSYDCGVIYRLSKRVR